MEPLVRALVIIARDHVPKTDLLTSAILPIVPLPLVLIARAIQIHCIASVHLAEEGLALVPRVAAAFIPLVVAGTRALLGFLRGGRVEVADALVRHGATGRLAGRLLGRGGGGGLRAGAGAAAAGGGYVGAAFGCARAEGGLAERGRGGRDGEVAGCVEAAPFGGVRGGGACRA